MAMRPARQCLRAGCGELVPRGSGGYCAKHAPAARGRNDAPRLSAAARGYDWAWQRLRDRFSRAHPTCMRCGKPRRRNDPVHHIKPVALYPELRLEITNLEALCFVCHEIEEGRRRG